MFREITEQEYLTLSQNRTQGSFHTFFGSWGFDYPQFHSAQGKIYVAETENDLQGPIHIQMLKEQQIESEQYQNS